MHQQTCCKIVLKLKPSPNTLLFAYILLFFFFFCRMGQKIRHRLKLHFFFPCFYISAIASPSSPKQFTLVQQGCKSCQVEFISPSPSQNTELRYKLDQSLNAAQTEKVGFGLSSDSAVHPNFKVHGLLSFYTKYLIIKFFNCNIFILVYIIYYGLEQTRPFRLNYGLHELSPKFKSEL